MQLNQQQSTGKIMKSKPKYVVTPGLIEYFFKFISHCRAAEDAPIMITGATGVGKSLFLHTYKKFFENEQKTKGIQKPIVAWANCAHFGGVNSDPNIARAELFGQKKGSSYGVDKDRKGLVDVANNGALILEEIGELPLVVQAMLLTFIETGEYREVGGTKTKYANIRIVGATNHEDALRKDFKYRLFPFYLPDLNSRRGDVLYYLSYLHPNLLSTLTRHEVLKMLAYNWPGNVREIERVARLIYRDKLEFESPDADAEEKLHAQIGRFYRLDERDTPLNKEKSYGLLDVMSGFGGDGEFLESLLNKFGVGLAEDEDDHTPAFKDFQPEFEQTDEDSHDLAMLEKQYDVKILLSIKQFKDAFSGYLAFCGLFMLDPIKNTNVYENVGSGDIRYLKLPRYREEEKRRVHDLVKAIMQWTKQLILESFDVNQSLADFWDELCEYSDKEPFESKSVEAKPQRKDVFDLPEKVLMREYYLILLQRHNNNVKAAAEKAGLHQSTFRSRLKKMGLENIKERKKRSK